MAIAEEDVRRVKDATDVVAAITERVALKRVGGRWAGLCPFHAEKTASFYVNPALGTYHCFGCGAHGDVITFLRETQGLSFVEAVERLAARAGVAIEAEDPRAVEARRRRATLLEAMERAAAWYHERLLAAPDAAAARGYLRSRGYDGEVARRFRIGWAPAGWDLLVRALDLPPEVLRDTGLGYAEHGRRTDAFRERVLFPIADHQGSVIGFGGRQLPGGRPPKYKNTTETPLYRKSEVLYGLDRAKLDVIRSEVAVLCEGYTDVVAFHLAGVTTAVATCGTAATEDHVRRLKAFGARRLVLGYDADAAGQGAAERFLAWEATHQLDLRVLALPPGADPADVGRSDPAALQRAVDEAVPFMAFRLRRTWQGADLRTAEGRARAAAAAVAVVAEHPDPLVRDQYVMEIADRTRTEPERLRTGLHAGGRGGPPPVGDGAARAARRSVVPPVEQAALWFAVHQPQAVLRHLEPELLDADLAVAAFHALAAAATFDEAVANAEDDVASLLARLAVEEAPAEDPDDVLAQLVRQRGEEALGESRRLVGRDDLAGEELAARAAEVALLRTGLEDLVEPSRRTAALDRLVPWLVDHRRDG